MSIKPGYYQHFKGHVYLVLGVSKHTETEEELVIYYNLEEIWARPLTMFTENVLHNGLTVPRFRFIGTDLSEAEAYLNIHTEIEPAIETEDE
jgi:hypothetical protein